MNDTKSQPALPDRLAGNPKSPFYSEEVFEFEIGIMLNGKEHCISEGWVKIPSPKALDRRGQPLMMTLKGKVEAFYK
ncbi:MAG: DUF3297 family protein [Psychrobium sp.]|nr:DUF3297 family protein [Psychrobium sp.]